jgi:acetylornithine deacetylase/succinyl-diaminopimelate desuccinylase-like protein
MDSVENIISSEWDENILPILMEYIKIPNTSPAFDNSSESSVLTNNAMTLIHKWVCDQNIDGLDVTIYQLENKTPLLVCELRSNSLDEHQDILFYGHMDKQPPQTSEWSSGLAPYEPVIRNGKLYGRGGADDGYAVFSTIIMFKLLEKYNVPHGRYLLLIEASEESGSVDLPDYIQLLTSDNDKYPIKLGNTDLVVCLDSGCNDYEKMWLTTSLRGTINMDLKISTLTNSKHSGDAGGVVPEPFNILRSVLDRLVDTNGNFTDEFNKYLTVDMLSIIEKYPLSNDNQKDLYSEYNLLPQIQLASTVDKLLYNRTWNPTFTLIGMDGVPNKSNAGNIILPEMTFRFSMRIPPYLKSDTTFNIVKNIIEKTPPYNAKVELNLVRSCDGWVMPYNDKLLSVIKQVTNDQLGYQGEGGSIPFMNMLSDKFPNANFIVTGVLGPNSNAHGPDEFLHLEYVKKLTVWLYRIVSNL